MSNFTVNTEGVVNSDVFAALNMTKKFNNENSCRKAIPIEEFYSLHQDFVKQFKGEK
jgi:hypothetical protein